MANFTKSAWAAAVLTAACSTTSYAADYSDGLHKNDYKWMQFNLMHTIDQLPYSKSEGGYNDTYMEMEFGGRSGMWQLYGYVDVFDVLNDRHDDKHHGDNLYMKFAPRLSLDALTGKDLSFGPVKEVYIANLNSIGGPDGLFETFIGLGSDVEVPWLGTVGANLYARHVQEGATTGWNGYQFSMNWFKPVYNFSNGSFIAYQGYLDYMFDAKDSSTDGTGFFHGIYWHSDRYAVGYGLKYFNDVYGLQNGIYGLKTTGFGHYFDVTYKF
ncbi:outer membrane protein OmpK [Pseudaeromonas paramecii]|uniref:Outer membrane protein OmpK n=1 Tax=Pseudaeromonas paramecii TaxID=2138166 RepID=A0ABP8QBT1_9GAMM